MEEKELNRILDDMVLSHRELVKNNEALAANNAKLIVNNQALIQINSEAVTLARLNEKLITLCAEIAENLEYKEDISLIEKSWHLAIKEALGHEEL